MATNSTHIGHVITVTAIQNVTTIPLKCKVEVQSLCSDELAVQYRQDSNSIIVYETGCSNGVFFNRHIEVNRNTSATARHLKNNVIINMHIYRNLCTTATNSQQQR